MFYFKYFDNPLENAEFIDEKCQSCGSEENCLEGVYFNEHDDVVSVCLSCLKEGLIRVDIPDYIRKEIKGSDKFDKIDELERTPPVPWIQYNEWPVCCNDFTKYIGEWGRGRLIKESQDGNGLNYLLSILLQDIKERIVNEKNFWSEIGNLIAIYVFECQTCSKRIAVSQSY